MSQKANRGQTVDGRRSRPKSKQRETRSISVAMLGHAEFLLTGVKDTQLLPLKIIYFIIHNVYLYLEHAKKV
jgi:hypothetical protein